MSEGGCSGARRGDHQPPPELPTDGSTTLRKKKPKADRPKPKGVVTRKDLWRVEADILDSEAFSALSGSECKALLGFLRRRRWDKKRKRYTNCSDLVYTLKAMSYEANVSEQAALDARNTLILLGFIDLIHHADGLQGEVNVYSLVERYAKWHPDPGMRKANGFREINPPSPGNEHGGFPEMTG